MTAPLAGLRVVVTRPEHQSASLIEAFRAAGAIAEPLPLIEVGPPGDPAPLETAARELDRYEWLVLTSSNGVDAVLDRLPGRAAGAASGAPTSSAAAALPASLRIAAIGPATADALRRRGLEPALIADDRRAEGLAAELAPHLSPGARVLLPQPPDARPVLAAELARAGARVDSVVAYAKRLPPGAPDRARALFGDRGPLGWVTFTSPSIARAFAGLFPDTWPDRRATLRAASIGAVTSEALRTLGVEPAAEAESPGDAELVAAVIAAVAAERDQADAATATEPTSPS